MSATQHVWLPIARRKAFIRRRIEQWLAADAAIASFLGYFLRFTYLVSRRAAEAKRYASIETLGRLKVEMKKPTKVLLGLATLWPFFYLILFFVVIFSTIMFVPGSGEPGPPPLIALIIPLHLFTMLAGIALIGFIL